MPCNGEYLEPTEPERQRRMAAEMLLWLLEQLGMPQPKWVVDESNNIYARDRRLIPQLCKLIGMMVIDKPVRFQELIYNARDRMSRRLADFWDDHQEMDAERIRREKEEKDLRACREAALCKLTDEEIEALGLK